MVSTPRSWDVVIVAALIVAGQIESWGRDDPSIPHVLLEAIALAAVVPLLVRRERPFVVHVATTALVAVWWLTAGDGHAALFPVAAIIVTMVTVAVSCPLRTAVAGLVIVLVTPFVTIVVIDGGSAGFVYAVVAITCVWGAGRAARSLGPPVAARDSLAYFEQLHRPDSMR